MIWNSGGHAYLYQNCTSLMWPQSGGWTIGSNDINSNGVVVGKSKQAAAADARSPIPMARCTIWEAVQIR